MSTHFRVVCPKCGGLIAQCRCPGEKPTVKAALPCVACSSLVDAPVTLTVRYSCQGCHLKDVGVVVPVRGPEEEVTHWMQKVVVAHVANDHLRRSPWCNAHVLQELKIPIPPGANVRIGDPTVQ